MWPASVASGMLHSLVQAPASVTRRRSSNATGDRAGRGLPTIDSKPLDDAALPADYVMDYIRVHRHRKTPWMKSEIELVTLRSSPEELEGRLGTEAGRERPSSERSASGVSVPARRARARRRFAPGTVATQ